MSEENVEIVRTYLRDLDRALAAHWADPTVPFAETDEAAKLRGRLHEHVIWRSAFTPEEFRGADGVNRAVIDWLDATDEWRITVEELTDTGEDGVFGVLRVHTRGKGSGAAVDQHLFTVFAVRDGKIALIQDHTERAEALKAAGLSE